MPTVSKGPLWGYKTKEDKNTFERLWYSRNKSIIISRKRENHKSLPDSYIRKVLDVKNPTDQQIEQRRTAILGFRARRVVKMINGTAMIGKTIVNQKEISQDIQRFSELIQAGIDTWTQAGNLLVQLLQKDANCFAKILTACPQISLTMLMVFERIGRKQIYAPLLADNSLAARRLLEMPYPIQEKYFKEPIDVAVSWNNGKIKSEKKLIGKLSRAEVMMVFGVGEINNLEQQAWRLNAASKEKVIKEKPEKKNPIAESNFKKEDVGYFCITRNPSGEVKIAPCGKVAVAQTVRLMPNSKGESATFALYRVK